jgi:hypothetical protein
MRRLIRIGYTITSQMSANKVSALVTLPEKPFAATVKLRLRAPKGKRMQTVVVNGNLRLRLGQHRGTGSSAREVS